MRRDVKIMGTAALAAIGLAWALRPPRRVGECKVKLAGMFTRGVDTYAPWAQVAVCDNEAKPGVIAFRDWILGGVGGTDLGIGRNCDSGAPSKHHEGRAWDWAPPATVAGDALTTCLTSADEDGEADAVARRAGLRTIIWNRRIWIAGQGWKPYRKPGGSPHTDHVHFGFGWPGANGQTSLYEVLESGGMVPTSDVELTIEIPRSAVRSGPPQEIKAKRTPLKPKELAQVLRRAHRSVFGTAPSYERLGMAWAMVNHETARTRSAWNNNLGNIMFTMAHEGDWHTLRTGPGEPTRYRSYDTPEDGAVDYWSLLKRRYEGALVAFDTGDPHTSAHALKDGGYYQAPVQTYSNALGFFFDEYKRDFDPAELAREDTPAAAIVVALTLAVAAAAALADR